MKAIIEGPPIAVRLTQSMKRASDTVHAKMVKAANQGARAIETQGRADISQAGRFGSRWTEGFTAQVNDQQQVVSITVREAVPYWTVFQYGKIIRGRPLLWIPSGPDTPKYLFRRGVPPAVITVRQVRIPKKFHLIEIARQVGGTLGQLYKLYSAGI